MNEFAEEKTRFRSARHHLILAVASGVMLAGAFPPSPFHSLAYVGLIPLLLLLETLEGTWKRLQYSYLAFFIWHTLTLYWIGGFVVGKDIWMMIAGGTVLLAHPLFYVFVVFLYLKVRDRAGLMAALAFLPLAWIGFEYSHSLSEVSFPWITLGNSQAYDLPRMQIAEYTSVYGLSFLVLCFNVIGFVVVTNLATRTWTIRSRAAMLAGAILVTLYVAPWIYGKIEIARYSVSPGADALRVGVVQPNIDPWEKWNSHGESPWASYDKQLADYLRETRALAQQRADMVVWPETAIPFRILLPGNGIYWRWLRGNLDTSGVSVLTGLPFTVFYDSAHAPLTASYDPVRKRSYDDFNSTTLLVPGHDVGPIYKKIVLVPFAERIPYAATFSFLMEPLKWNVGIGMWGKGSDTIVFSLPLKEGREAKFASMICYESVYPNFVREFVHRGAQFLVIITNDSWWGNTSGAYQHAAYASFRAIENRRWIVRAANGGISGFIDPAGTYHNETTLYTAAAFSGTIGLSEELSFYARHGDMFARSCAGLAVVFFIVTFLPQRNRAKKP